MRIECKNCGSDDAIFAPLDCEAYGPWVCNVCGNEVGFGDEHHCEELI